MTTAEERIKESFPDWHDWPEWTVDATVKVMKDYAKDVAQETLNQAADNAVPFIDSEPCGGWWRDVAAVEKDSITTTQIITP